MLLVQTFQTTLYLLPGDDGNDDDDISTDESPEEKGENVDVLATSVRIVVDDEFWKHDHVVCADQAFRLQFMQNSLPIPARPTTPISALLLYQKANRKRFVHIRASVFFFFGDELLM